MNKQLPEYLLCEDPTSEQEKLFIYHVPTGSLVQIIHTDILSKIDAEAIKSADRRHFDYTYKNTVGNIERIMFIAEVVDRKNNDEQSVLELSAHWYACYLGWEDECEDIIEGDYNKKAV